MFYQMNIKYIPCGLRVVAFFTYRYNLFQNNNFDFPEEGFYGYEENLYPYNYLSQNSPPPHIHLNHNNKYNTHKNIHQNNKFAHQNNSNIISEEEKGHLRGLVNIASTCYMNSILQCFSNIKELANYFQSNKMNQLACTNYNDENKFYPVFQEVIINLWNTYENTPYYPNNFKTRLGKLNPLFQGAYPNDAKDLLTFILLKLHEELNKPKNYNMNNNIPTVNEQKDKKLMFKKFSEFFMNNYRSVVSGLFYGIFYTKTQCCHCQAIQYNYQTFNFLIFPLQQVLQYKISLTNYTSICNNTITIEDCFKHYQLNSNLNDYYCNVCKTQGNSQYANKLSILPNIIIIILNRGKGLQYKVNISFENENLGLKQYVEYSKDECIYELIGMVTHYGESNAGGHFMARCKSPIDGNWYLYNDQNVTKIGREFDKYSFSQGNPYILFYKKINFKK